MKSTNIRVVVRLFSANILQMLALPKFTTHWYAMPYAVKHLKISPKC